MDYFQGVVTEFLRSNRATFVNTECCIQLDPTPEPLKGRHWYCDAVAASFQDKTLYLCEVTYSRSLQALVRRLQAWDASWPLLCEAVYRDCAVPSDWGVQPWAFVPGGLRELLVAKLTAVGIGQGRAQQMPLPRITSLEEILPWKYSNWNRPAESLP